MKRPDVIAEVVEPGQCQYFYKGQRFMLGGFTPAGLCASAYAVLARDAQTMRCGGTLPWARQEKVLTRCPDPQGALWQLRIDGAAERADAERKEATSEPSESDGYQVLPCRGLQGACPFALVKDPSLVRQVDDAIRASAWWQGRKRGHSTFSVSDALTGSAATEKGECPLFPRGRALPPHARLRVALAACPNACTMPQIRDIGIIATRAPQAIRPACDGCGRCAQACREEAITIRSGRAEWHEDRCVGCGQCLDQCPSGALASGPMRLRLLVGGRMGRHPRWARELGAVDAASGAEVVRVFLDCMAADLSPAGHVAEAIERMGLERLRQAIVSAVGGKRGHSPFSAAAGPVETVGTEKAECPLFLRDE